MCEFEKAATEYTTSEKGIKYFSMSTLYKFIYTDVKGNVHESRGEFDRKSAENLIEDMKERRLRYSFVLKKVGNADDAEPDIITG